MSPTPARARACANIALVKYWGKRDRRLNIPAAGSLSLTLEALATETEVTFGHEGDSLVLDETPVTGRALTRLTAWLDIIRSETADKLGGAHVVSSNNFPTASGLASSASAYAALAVAASAAAGNAPTITELSILARRGSGSAARSLFGGIALMHAGSLPDGSDSFAQSLQSPAELADWPLAMVIAVVGGGKKKAISSRDAMSHCAETSPLYAGWLASVPPDLATAQRAIEERNFDGLGVVCEGSALAMHAAAWASRPAIRYTQPATLRLLERVGELRASGVPAYFTMDAGPHVKVLTLSEHTADVAKSLSETDGVSSVIVSGVGAGAALVQ